MPASHARTALRLAVLLAATLLAILAWQGRGNYSPVDTGGRVPAYGAPDLRGDTVDLASLRGRVVLLNVWATWCKPCVKEMPALQRLHEMLDPEGLSVVAVSVDNAALSLGTADGDVRSFVDEYGITFTVLLDPQSRIESVFQVTGLPMTFVIDRDGILRKKVLGARVWDEPASVAELRTWLEN